LIFLFKLFFKAKGTWSMLRNTSEWISLRLKNYLQVDNNELGIIKYLAASFFFTIGTYSTMRSLKSSVFIGMVGVEYLPYCKLIMMLLIFPLGFFYSHVVDKLKKHQVVFCIYGFYAIGSIVFALLFLHPVLGIKNTVSSPYRILGWVFEIFMDLYPVFVVSTFWAFTTSISSTSFAKKGYGFIVAASRIGGILTTVLSLFLINQSNFFIDHSIAAIVFASSIFLAAAVYCMYKVVKKFPENYLSGYEKKAVVKTESKKSRSGIFKGISLMISEPYVLGIFGIVYCCEIVAIVIDYQMQILMSLETNKNFGAMSSFMLSYTAAFQFFGFLFAFFGAAPLLQLLGVRTCLMIMPIFTLALSGILLLNQNLLTIFFVMVFIRALNYGFNSPVRETLYIPTVKDIQFKSRMWIESFGKSFSKTSGSVFNMVSAWYPAEFVLQLDSVFCMAVSVAYSLIAAAVGYKYTKTINAQEVIGIKPAQRAKKPLAEGGFCDTIQKDA
jgi:ATP:ADP antiporter, AAA family